MSYGNVFHILIPGPSISCRVDANHRLSHEFTLSNGPSVLFHWQPARPRRRRQLNLLLEFAVGITSGCCESLDILEMVVLCGLRLVDEDIAIQDDTTEINMVRALRRSRPHKGMHTVYTFTVRNVPYYPAISLHSLKTSSAEVYGALGCSRVTFKFSWIQVTFHATHNCFCWTHLTGDRSERAGGNYFAYSTQVVTICIHNCARICGYLPLRYIYIFGWWNNFWNMKLMPGVCILP